jgi:hypothetical protein
MEEDDGYLASMLTQQAELDAEKELEEEEGLWDDQQAPSVRVPLEMEESDLYDDPNNVNNLARSVKWIPSYIKQENTGVDGNTYCFISTARGPLFSNMCQRQLCVINYLLKNPPHRRRILRTSQLVPTFDSEDNLTTLMERVKLTTDEVDIMEGARQDVGGMRVDAIPLDKVVLCD